MSSTLLTRRRFLTLPLALLLAPGARAFGEGDGRRTSYAAKASILYGALRYRVAGSIDERVDRAAGRYEVRMEGQGTSFSNRAEATGILLEGRWAPLQSRSWVKIAGREGRSEVAYDYERRLCTTARSGPSFSGAARVDDVCPPARRAPRRHQARS
jgi:hypothetical protein